jgi:hypothetical protein
MQAYRCTAEEAVTRMVETADRTGTAMEQLVADLRFSVSAASAMNVMGDPET